MRFGTEKKRQTESVLSVCRKSMKFETSKRIDYGIEFQYVRYRAAKEDDHFYLLSEMDSATR